MVLTPAFVFWLGGIAAALQRWGWQIVSDFVTAMPEGVLLAVGILGLMVVAISGVVVEQFQFVVLRLLEGYWPRWYGCLRSLLVWWQRWQQRSLDQQWQKFNQRGLTNLTAEEKQTYIKLDLELSKFPDPSRLLPTRLGNCLRASEDRCKEKYGLDAIICWPRLWLILPETAKGEISAARDGLNLTVRLWAWCVIFGAWAAVFRVWWPLLLGVGAAWLVQGWMLQAAQVYGTLVESAFDLYRFQLYEALHWPLPMNPAEERSQGEALTVYLWHGSELKKPQFIE